MKQIVLGGGGSAEKEARVLAHLSSLVPSGGRVLNLPWAQPDPAHPGLHDWIQSALGPFGMTNVVSVQTVDEQVCRYVDSFDAVFMGGGNTYRLLHRLRETGLGAVLVRLNESGLPIYGGSAGAIVLGADIGTCAHLDRNESGVSDLQGLDRCGGAAVWCHYVESDDARIGDFVREVGVDVLCLPENAGVCVDSAGVGALGPGEVWRWHPGGRERVPAWRPV